MPPWVGCEDEEDLKDLIIARRGDNIIRLDDVADIRLGHFKIYAVVAPGVPVLGGLTMLRSPSLLRTDGTNQVYSTNVIQPGNI